MTNLHILVRKSGLTAVVTIFSVCIFYISAAQAAPGDLDTTFGTNGIVKTDLDNNSATIERATGVVIDGNGKYVVSAIANAFSSDSDFAVLRYNSDGTLDTTFDTDGKVITDIDANNKDFANGIAIDNNGKIVVVGTSKQDDADSNVSVVRYNSNGSLDTTFSFDGKYTIAFGGAQEGYAVAIQSDNKIVVAGKSGNGTDSSFLVARLNENGSPDITFGINGIRIAEFTVGDGLDEARAVVIQPTDSKILAVGIANKGATGDFALLRLMPNDGSIDADVGPLTGKITVSFGGDDGAYAVDVDQSGAIDTIIVAGQAAVGSVSELGVSRHKLVDLTLDTNFDTDGKATVAASSGMDRAFGVKVESDGKYVIVGGADRPAATTDFTVARLNNNGSPDSRFGNNGVVVTDTSGANITDEALAVALSSIIAVGLDLNTSNIVVAKYLDDVQENDFPWEIFIPAITGMSRNGNSPPSKPINPVPADGAGDQSTNTIISWENGGLATSYDIYFGTNPTPSDFKGNQTTTDFDPGTLLNDTTYYWRIDAISTTGTTTGDVWHFSTSTATIEQNCCIAGVCSPLSTSNCQQAGGIPINAPCDPNPCR